MLKTYSKQQAYKTIVDSFPLLQNEMGAKFADFQKTTQHGFPCVTVETLDGEAVEFFLLTDDEFAYLGEKLTDLQEIVRISGSAIIARN